MSITWAAVHWAREGKRKRGRPKTTWRKTVEGELQHHRVGGRSRGPQKTGWNGETLLRSDGDERVSERVSE